MHRMRRRYLAYLPYVYWRNYLLPAPPRDPLLIFSRILWRLDPRISPRQFLLLQLLLEAEAARSASLALARCQAPYMVRWTAGIPAFAAVDIAPIQMDSAFVARRTYQYRRQSSRPSPLVRPSASHFAWISPLSSANQSRCPSSEAPWAHFLI